MVLSELAALINEHCFEYLDAPVMRASMDTPVPFAVELENQFLPLEELDKNKSTCKLLNENFNHSITPYNPFYITSQFYVKKIILNMVLI